MKKTVLSLVLGSATLFLAASRADVPKAAPPAPPAPAMNAAQAELLKRFDRNHDGKLDESELAIAHETMLKQGFTAAPGDERPKKIRAAMLKRFDKNGDGQLDAGERAEMRREILARFDKNGDGHLDENERAAMRAAFKAENKALKLKN
ncbi:MAG: EF-hand domain-containing protein [Opitutaceae bacterium]